MKHQKHYIGKTLHYGYIMQDGSLEKHTKQSLEYVAHFHKKQDIHDFIDAELSKLGNYEDFKYTIEELFTTTTQ